MHQMWAEVGYRKTFKPWPSSLPDFNNLQIRPFPISALPFIKHRKAAEHWSFRLKVKLKISIKQLGFTCQMEKFSVFYIDS